MEKRVDVNGTRYHLLYGCEDWGSCFLDDEDRTLSTRWSDDQDHPALEWDCGSSSVRLAREVPLFRGLRNSIPLDISARRGAGSDSFGNWYWIDASEQGILFSAQGDYRVQSFWAAQEDVADAALTPDTGAFATCPQPPTRRLRGLAVTTRNYLVVGDATHQGLLIFDLYSGGNPIFLHWPKDVNFMPWDLAATPDGGVLVLDRDHSTYWALDASLRLQADVQDSPFQPKGSMRRRRSVHKKAQPLGYHLTKGNPAVPLAAVSIETGPHGHALILETDPSLAYSTIYEYSGAQLVASYPLEQIVEVMDPLAGEGIPELYSVIGHDFAYFESGGTNSCGCNARDTSIDAGDELDACGCPVNPDAQQHVIYVADHAGKQAFGFRIDRPSQTLRDLREYLPLRGWDGKAIVTAGQQVFYNYVKQGSSTTSAPMRPANAATQLALRAQAGQKENDRWVPLMVFAECHYVGLAVLATSTNFQTDSFDEPKVAGMPFDSNIPGCTWHRLLLDAQIPPGTEIAIRARASDDPELLTSTGWSAQPGPYLRSGGAELAYYYPWKDLGGPGSLGGSANLPEGTGTWELLFQDISGRYLQLELTIRGNGRATPAIRALRAWYPRFSYLEQYLPAVYREDPISASFLDRWLANFEGLYTNLEEKIEHVAELFDPRTAPAETLSWLACWLGLLLDPLWDEGRRRILIRHVEKLYRLRGTVAGVEIAVRLYVDNKIEDSLFDLSKLGQGTVRIIECFATRGTGPKVYGPRTPTGQRPLIDLTPQIVSDNAHRFIVQVPHDLTAKQLDMVTRIVTLEKPAHTAFEVILSSETFYIGAARLGLDTRIGENRQYVPAQLGNAYLAGTYLQTPFPYTIPDRMVRNRDYQ